LGKEDEPGNKEDDGGPKKHSAKLSERQPDYSKQDGDSGGPGIE
jgi:hypothetical protein